VSETRINIYEGLFLFPQSQTADLQGALDHLQEILKRAKAEIISLRKWEERRLAYEIKGNKRGLYFLVYFRVRGDALVDIERDCNLSELLLRFMIVRADEVTQEQMEAAEGRAQLADEITLRASQAAESRANEVANKVPTGHEGSIAKPAEQPIEAEAQRVPRDATTTIEPEPA